jgi:hypothetical protein
MSTCIFYYKKVSEKIINFNAECWIQIIKEINTRPIEIEM